MPARHGLAIDAQRLGRGDRIPDADYVSGLVVMGRPFGACEEEMNRLHRRYCQSEHWKRVTHNEVLPWALDGIDLGDDVLEVGPGPGVTTDWLRHRVKRVDCLEIDAAQAGILQRRLAETNVKVRCGDATAMPYRDCQFSAVVSFTMMHHIPTPRLQDRFFADSFRVLSPGGIFAGVDSLPSLLMRLFHFGDTMTLVAPDTLISRLVSAGFTEAHVEAGSNRFRFSARRPKDPESRKQRHLFTAAGALSPAGDSSSHQR